MGARAVVFAYHNVGARALRVLRRHGVDVALVVTHPDNPQEVIWFDRVADVATALDMQWIAPADPNAAEIVQRIAGIAPDFVFSFYYRQMLGPALLATPARGALNLHGSLLPKYRGRVPVNLAVLRGETETGVTLHYMDVKPDAGDIVAQRTVPIGPDDTAHDVFVRMTDAGEQLLDAVLPPLLAGTAPRTPNRLQQGSYFGARTAEDGRIDWTQPATALHNLVRAVAPPYPGAFFDAGAHRVRILRTERGRDWPRSGRAGLFAHAGQLYVQAGDGERLRVASADLDGAPLTADVWLALRPDGTAG